MRPWEVRCASELDALRRQNRFRLLRRGRVHGRWMDLDGRRLLQCASNDYLGLSVDPRVRQAAMAAADEYGGGATGSRLISGNHGALTTLEEALAVWHGTEAALVFSSGYATNVAVLSALARPGDVIFSDALNHASLIDGCRMSRAQVVIYRHADMDHLAQLLSETPCDGQRWIVSDAVFSMDGDIAPLPELVRVARRYGAALILDDAHGVGVLGQKGSGIAEHFGMAASDVDVYIGTLSKALAAEGGYVAGSRVLIDYVINRARPFIFSTGLAPASAGAARAARDIAEAESWRRRKLAALAARLRSGLVNLGFRVTGQDTPIVPVVIGTDHDVVRVSQCLLEEGLFAPAIRPPTVPEGEGRIRLSITEGRIRLSITADHDEADIDFILQVFTAVRNEVPGVAENRATNTTE
jgi:8-amino-7-oxononanoate synthase